MKKSLLVALSMAASVTLAGCNSTSNTETAVKPTQAETAQNDAEAANTIKMANTQTVTGTVSYRERIALPPTAVVTVSLLDTSLADAPAKVIAEQTFDTAGKYPPYQYSLQFNSANMEMKNSYVVSATIKVDGKLRFTTDTSYPVITDKAATMQQDLVLKGVSQ